MQVIRYRPRAPLDSYVECLWWSKRDKPEQFGEHMLPSGNAQMIFTLHESPILCDSRPWSRGIVHGPQSRYHESGPKPRGATTGISIRAAAAGAILGVPVRELTDRHESVDALWGRRGLELREQLLTAQGPAAVFQLLERELTARLVRPLVIHPAVARALARRGSPWASFRVAEIQRATGYSPRHFIALFREAVGMTPKHYYRIKRFTSALRLLANGGRGSLAEVSAAAGYSDQAHLTREFREFAGITPTKYNPRNAASILHHRMGEIAGPRAPGQIPSRRS
jgi:AraC-like DNA-binding protein